MTDIGLGILGAGFIGQMHALAFRNAGVAARPLRLRPRLKLVCDRTGAQAHDIADRYGFERSTTDWHDIVADPAIALFVNAGPNNLHGAPSIAAGQGGQARLL